MCFIFAISQGTYPLSLEEILTSLIDESDPIHHMIVTDNRLPRILVAIGSGIAFGIAGTLFQTMLRNPLASPDWIGFTSGASFGALMAIYLFGGYLILGALIGVIVTAFIVIALAFDNGLNIRKLIIIGIGANLTIGASADLLLSRVDLMTAADMARWLVGSLSGRDWSDVQLLWIGIIILIPFIYMLEFPLKRLLLGENAASGLGLNVSFVRLCTSAVGILLVTLAVCVAGPLPFVAFVSAPIAKRLEGSDAPTILSSALVGGLIVLFADFISRFTPIVQLPTGVFTALIGAPILIWLLILQTRSGKLL
ncbi:MAG: iron chelate uptake ABC transporter family permease subunit [Pseudomonadota bacterium]